MASGEGRRGEGAGKESLTGKDIWSKVRSGGTTGNGPIRRARWEQKIPKRCNCTHWSRCECMCVCRLWNAVWVRTQWCPNLEPKGVYDQCLIRATVSTAYRFLYLYGFSRAALRIQIRHRPNVLPVPLHRSQLCVCVCRKLCVQYGRIM